MTDEWFWCIVESSWPSAEDLLSPIHLQKYFDTLALLQEPDLCKFGKAKELAKKQANKYNLWDAAYVLNNGCGDDDFANFRAGLIALGKEVFYRVLESPDEALAALPIAEQLIRCEAFDYVPCEVYEHRFGNELPEAYLPHTEPEGTYLGCGPDPEILEEKYPLLFNKYWNNFQRP